MEVELVNSEGFSLAIYTDPIIIQREKDNGAIEVPIVASNFIRKKWDFVNGIWTEGATQAEIDSILQSEKLRLSEQINNIVADLDTKALSSSLGLVGTRDFLTSQRGIYKEKNDVANGKVNVKMEQTIVDQMDRNYSNETDLNNDLIALGVNPTGNKLKKYKDLVKASYTKSENDYAKFTGYIEDFRTIANRHLKNNDLVKAEEVISIADSVLPLAVNDVILTAKRAEALNV